MSAPDEYGPETYTKDQIEAAFFADVPLETRLAATEAGLLLASQVKQIREVEDRHGAAEVLLFINHLGDMFASGLPGPLVQPILDGLIAMSLMAIRAYDSLESVEA